MLNDRGMQQSICRINAHVKGRNAGYYIYIYEEKNSPNSSIEHINDDENVHRVPTNEYFELELFFFKHFFLSIILGYIMLTSKWAMSRVLH